MGYTAFNLTSMEEARGLSFKIFHSSPGCVPVLCWPSPMTLLLQGTAPLLDCDQTGMDKYWHDNCKS